MKIAISNLPLKTAHKTRGIGYYTNHLLAALKQDDSIGVCEFTKQSEIISADVVHYLWFDLFFHSLPIRKKFPTVVTIHDVIPLLFLKHYPMGIRGKINFTMQKIALKSCKYIITDSKASKVDIIKYLRIKNEKIAVIPLAADAKFKVLNDDARLLRAKRKYNLPDRFLLYVGDANWVKNLPFLIEGFCRLIKIPKFNDVKLVLVGGVFLKNVEKIDHPELESLKLVNQLIKQNEIEQSVIRPGQIEDDDLVTFYNLASIYVHPAFYEGFGLPILQAFACGTPVACSNKGSLIEVGGDAAVYFNPYNTNQFVSIVKEILQDRSLRTRLSKLGIEQAARFSWEKVAEETKLVYLKAKNE